MALERLVSVLWCTDGAGKAGLQELEERCAQLEEQLAQERDHVAMLNRYIKGTSKNEEFQACSHLQKNALRRQGVY